MDRLEVLGIAVPVMKNFKGFTELIASVDEAFIPIVVQNWSNNIGVSAGWNFGLRTAIAENIDYLLIPNDDVILHPATLYKLMGELQDKIFITGSAGSSVEAYDEHPDFACFMVQPHKFVERYGWFDENFSPAYFEDNDMAYRIKLAGDKYIRRLDATFTHAGSVTQNMDGPVVSSAMFERNRAYYRTKWGADPLAEIYTHPFNDESKHPNDWTR